MFSFLIFLIQAISSNLKLVSYISSVEHEQFMLGSSDALFPLKVFSGKF